jgi:hypothetical protein
MILNVLKGDIVREAFEKASNLFFGWDHCRDPYG